MHGGSRRQPEPEHLDDQVRRPRLDAHFRQRASDRGVVRVAVGVDLRHDQPPRLPGVDSGETVEPAVQAQGARHLSRSFRPVAPAPAADGS
jgi:hypothetical protein